MVLRPNSVPCGTTQYLHVGDVTEFHGRAHRPSHVDIIDVYADARIDGWRGIRLANAANEYLRRGVVTGQCSVRMELDVRRHLVEIGGADNLLALERVSAQRSDCHWCVLQAFLATARVTVMASRVSAASVPAPQVLLRWSLRHGADAIHEQTRNAGASQPSNVPRVDFAVLSVKRFHQPPSG
jgi:hypothetical protein